jgi:uncharacterized protein YkwD
MQLHRHLGAYGVTLVLGLFGMSGLVRACKPAPAPAPVVTAVVVMDECVGMVNLQRATAGLAPVAIDARIQTSAQAHSNYQAKVATMRHQSANGANAGARLTASGFPWHAWGENVAAGQTDCTSVMDAWMNSPGHRANILNPVFTYIGVAGAVNSAGTIYWTMDLAAA